MSYYVSDNLGSTRALTNSAGAVTDTYSYDAYGNLIASTGSTVNPYLFTGEWFDAAIGQYYLRARDYNPILGRFSGKDPYPGSSSDPLSLNHYAYAFDDPITYDDPSGMLAEADVLTAVEIGVNFAANLGISVLSAGVFLSLIAAADPLLEEVAQLLRVSVSVEIDTQEEDPNYVYFVHGTSYNAWDFSTSIKPDEGGQQKTLARASTRSWLRRLVLRRPLAGRIRRGKLTARQDLCSL